MIRFFAPEIVDTGELPEAESAHCCRVLRMTSGDVIEITDGKGNLFECRILDAHPKHTSVEILSQSSVERHWSPRITLAVAPTKNFDRMEWLIEKAVEIGVDRLVFVDCKRNVRRVVKNERVEKIMVSAMKQSLKCKLPDYDGLVPVTDFLSGCEDGEKYMGYCDEAVERHDFSKSYRGSRDVVILIGPEGDFTSEEVAAAMDSGFQPVTFGNTRLRTETAALYALCATHTIITQNT